MLKAQDTRVCMYEHACARGGTCFWAHSDVSESLIKHTKSSVACLSDVQTSAESDPAFICEGSQQWGRNEDAARQTQISFTGRRTLQIVHLLLLVASSGGKCARDVQHSPRI